MDGDDPFKEHIDSIPFLVKFLYWKYRIIE